MPSLTLKSGQGNESHYSDFQALGHQSGSEIVCTVLLEYVELSAQTNK